VEKASADIKVKLVDGRRMRFARETEPEAVHAMIELLEEVSP